MAGQQQQHTTKLSVEFDGRPMPTEVEPLLVSALVDGNRLLPDLFTLSFRDPQREILSTLGVRIGSTVRLGVASDGGSGREPLLSGEVTALELDYDQRDTLTVVRGFDHSHRLFRGIRTHSYTDVTYADVVRKVARRAGLSIDTVDQTTTVHPHLSQAAENDWDFLSGLATEVGYELFVKDGKLSFRAPSRADRAPGTAGLTAQNPQQLVYGSNLLRLRATVTAAEQVNDIEVRGWDITQKKAVAGRAPARTSSVSLATTPADLAGTFGGGTHVRTGRVYRSQAEVDSAARVTAEEVTGTFAELDGVARGNPKLEAGTPISLSLLGEAFDGKYTLSSVRHSFDPVTGYTTAFTVSGRQDRSLLALTHRGGPRPARRTPGVVAAQVTDVADPDKLGRVKLTFPWLSDDYTSDWVRTLQPGAGPERGFVVLPEVGDEVLVAFEQGDVGRPYVLGGLYNGVDRLRLGDGELVDANQGKIRRRGFVSRLGHTLTFDDDQDAVTISSSDGSLELALDQAGSTLRLRSRGKVEITGDQDVLLKSSANLTVEAGGKLALKGGTVEVTGQPIKLN